jgi:hypothetical protein
MIMGNMTIANQCPWCGRPYEFEVSYDGYIQWRSGVLIQNAFPTLTPTEREYMLTGYCADCQKKLFGDDE